MKFDPLKVFSSFDSWAKSLSLKIDQFPLKIQNKP